MSAPHNSHRSLLVYDGLRTIIIQFPNRRKLEIPDCHGQQKGQLYSSAFQMVLDFSRLIGGDPVAGLLASCQVYKYSQNTTAESLYDSACLVCTSSAVFRSLPCNA